MELPLIIASIVTALACCLIFRQVYGRLRSGFFFYLPVAFLSLTCACALLSVSEWSSAEAAADTGLALFGILLAAASVRLKDLFDLAGETGD